MQKLKIIHDKIIKRHPPAQIFVLSRPELKISSDKIVLHHNVLLRTDNYSRIFSCHF